MNSATSASTFQICAAATRSRLPGTLDPDTAATRALELAAALVTDGDPDPAATRAAVLLADPRARAEDVAAEIGLSMRQLRRRCHAVVGYGPKTLQRVLRFRRFVARIDAGPPNGQAGVDPGHDLAALAAQAGYADQAHLTRECRALAGLTPAALARQRGRPPASARTVSREAAGKCLDWDNSNAICQP